MKTAKLSLATLVGVLLLMAASATAQSWDSENPRHEAQPQGALSGASIFVSPGHGWFWNDKRWTTQRGNSHGIIEDFSNAEAVMQYFVKYLWNAGARVYTTRERCLNTNMVIVDDDDANLVLEGAWENQYAQGTHEGTQLRIETTNGEPTAFARYVPEIPEDGYYGVYVWYRPSTNGDTTKDAHITVNHTGGSTLWIQNQNHDGYTWKYIGSYYFEAGQSPDTGSVVVSNKTDGETAWVTADAVRFGGGMGDSMRGGNVSGKPRWEESGLYYTEFLGFDPEKDTRAFGTVGAMPMWAEWEMEPWEKGKSVYIGWHTNASGGAGKSRGLFSFVYGPNSWDPLTSFTGFPEGNDLCVTIHDQIMNTVHANYDPDWRDGSKVTRWLGETNPRNNNKMPAALFEYGFHDNAEDAAYILDPRFRDTISKGTYHGLVKFFAENMEGFDNTTLLPETPENLSVISTDEGVKISWNQPPYGKEGLGDRATSYKLYRSRNGKGFDNGTPVNGTETSVDVQPGELAFFRVAAINGGGESFPSETLGVRRPSGEQERILVVNGFDRLDRGLNIKLESGVERGILAHMNTFDYIIQHGKALDSLSAGFDSSSNEAVASGAVALADYDAVVWMLGQENNGSTFDAAERSIVQNYLENGGNIMISGSEAAADLHEHDQAFLRNTLHARLGGDNAEMWKVDGVLNSIFSGLQDISFDDGTGHLYKVQTPDILTPEGEAEPAMIYTGTLSPAAIQYNGKYRLVYMGFPFESIRTEKDRTEIMGRAIRFLLAGVPPKNTAMAE